MRNEDVIRRAEEWVEKYYPSSMFAEHERSIALHAYGAGLNAEGR
jgi:hypothetical protein